MRYIFLLLVFNGFLLQAQDIDKVPIRLFHNSTRIQGPFNVVYIGKDRIFNKEVEYVYSNVFKEYSIRICHNKYRMLIESNADEISSMDIYLSRRTFKKMLEEPIIKGGKLFKKYYYVDLGIDVIYKIPRSDRKLCYPIGQEN